MNLVDSSGWIEYFVDSSNATYFARAIEDEKNLIVPAICLYEVFRKLLHETDEATALQSVTQMQLGKVVDLDESLAIAAARLGHENKIPLADSIILATAYRYRATLLTMDEHFQGMTGVRYFSKKGK